MRRGSSLFDFAPKSEQPSLPSDLQRVFSRDQPETTKVTLERQKVVLSVSNMQ